MEITSKSTIVNYVYRHTEGDLVTWNLKTPRDRGFFKNEYYDTYHTSCPRLPVIFLWR